MSPNFDLLLWLILIGWGIRGVLSIIAGAGKWEKTTKYDMGDVILGIIHLSLFIWVLVSG